MEEDERQLREEVLEDPGRSDIVDSFLCTRYANTGSFLASDGGRKSLMHPAHLERISAIAGGGSTRPFGGSGDTRFFGGSGGSSTRPVGGSTSPGGGGVFSTKAVEPRFTTGISQLDLGGTRSRGASRRSSSESMGASRRSSSESSNDFSVLRAASTVVATPCATPERARRKLPPPPKTPPQKYASSRPPKRHDLSALPTAEATCTSVVDGWGHEEPPWGWVGWQPATRAHRESGLDEAPRPPAWRSEPRACAEGARSASAVNMAVKGGATARAAGGLDVPSTPSTAGAMK